MVQKVSILSSCSLARRITRFKVFPYREFHQIGIRQICLHRSVTARPLQKDQEGRPSTCRQKSLLRSAAQLRAPPSWLAPLASAERPALRRAETLLLRLVTLEQCSYTPERTTGRVPRQGARRHRSLDHRLWTAFLHSSWNKSELVLKPSLRRKAVKAAADWSEQGGDWLISKGRENNGRHKSREATKHLGTVADTLRVAIESDINIVKCDTIQSCGSGDFCLLVLELELGALRAIQGVSLSTARSDRVSNFVWGKGTASHRPAYWPGEHVQQRQLP